VHGLRTWPWKTHVGRGQRPSSPAPVEAGRLVLIFTVLRPQVAHVSPAAHASPAAFMLILMLMLIMLILIMSLLLLMLFASSSC
jgi:hypothetical protein